MNNKKIPRSYIHDYLKKKNLSQHLSLIIEELEQVELILIKMVYYK